MSFNGKREMVGGLDVMNIVTFHNNSFQRVKVGHVDLKDHGETEFILKEDLIMWHRRFNQVQIVGFPGKTHDRINWLRG